MTTTATQTVHKELDQADPNTIGDCLRKMGLGSILSPLKVTIAALAATQNIDITSAAVFAAATINVGALKQSRTTLPPILNIVTLRVTASGTGASLGTYTVTDSGGTAIVPPGGASAAVGIATLSADGKTLGFPNTITGFVITYIPRADTDMEAQFETLT